MARFVKAFLCLLFVLQLNSFAGCRCAHHACLSNPTPFAWKSRHTDDSNSIELDSAKAELKQAKRLARKGEARSVDAFFRATTLAWSAMQSCDCATSVHQKADTIYQQALSGLIKYGQCYGRLDPRQGLRVSCHGRPLFVPVIHNGFPRSSHEFDKLIPVDAKYSRTARELKNVYRCEGLGVSTVAQHYPRSEEPFRRQRQVFSATAVLRPFESHKDGATLDQTFVLELHDPVRVRELIVSGKRTPITRDTSAPVAYVLKNKDTNYVEAFLQPGLTDENTGMFMIEPYQAGKIPLVFVHGLLSDPYTWANMANELYACPEIIDRYQIWGFEYATGEPFLIGAAELREQLVELRGTFDPARADLALDQTILVGHSMGGLLSKLQITHSGDQVWQAVSNRPLHEIVSSESTRSELARAFYFEPSPDIARVVYMGTPHRGSPWAERGIGSFGAKLVQEPSQTQGEHQRLVCDNPNTFTEEFKRRVPTSIDMLRTDSALLLSVDQLPVAEGVQQHSIIGNYRRMIGAGESDGVVPVSSAVRENTSSDLLVRSNHNSIHSDDETVRELIRILREHARISQASQPPKR